MADNFSTLDAADATITGAADEIGGVKFPRVKLIHGADGTNDGDVSTANGLPVQGTVTANLSATDNAVLDDIASKVGNIPAKGQALAAASTPVVLPADQITTLTPPAAITGFATSAKQDTGNTSVASIDTKMGEVQATPTSNTVLGRLKDLLTGIVLNTGSAIIGKVGIDQTTPGTTNGVQVNAAIPAGTNLIGDVSLQPRTGNGCSVFRSIDIDESEEEVKGSAGNLYGYYFGNVATAIRYLKFYNDTAANVTVGTTTPFLTLPLPASSSGHISFPMPVTFSGGITVAATTGVADDNTGAPSANDVIINVFYK